MIHLIDQNFHLHAYRIPSMTKGMQVFHTENLSYVDSDMCCDTFNIIHLFNGENFPKGSLKKVLQHFQDKNFAYCLWVNQENLTDEVKNQLAEHALSKQNEEVGMVLDLEKYQIITNEKHQFIQEVTDTELLSDYAQVIAYNWSPPDQNVLDYYKETAQHYLNPDNQITLLTYYHEGQPASTVELFATDEQTVGLYGFATLEEFRRKGIGSALMTYCLNLAKEKGYRYVILQGTEDGLGIYRNYGFEAYTTYFEFA